VLLIYDFVLLSSFPLILFYHASNFANCSKPRRYCMQKWAQKSKKGLYGLQRCTCVFAIRIQLSCLTNIIRDTV